MELLTILYAVLAATLGWDGASVSPQSRPSVEAVESAPAAFALPCQITQVAAQPIHPVTGVTLADVARPVQQFLHIDVTSYMRSILIRLGQRRE